MSESPVRPAMSRKRMLQISSLVAIAIGVLAFAASLVIAYDALLPLAGTSLLLGVVWLVFARFVSDEPMRAAQLRYVREFFPAMVAYMILLFVSMPLVKLVHWTPLKTLVVLLPVLPMVLVMRAMLRLLLGSDELEQRQQLYAISLAAMGIGLLSFAGGFLQIAGLMPVENALILVLPCMFLLYGGSLWWVKRKYCGE